MKLNRLEKISSELQQRPFDFKGFNLLFLSQVFISENYLGAYKSWKIIAKILKRFSLENYSKWFFTKLRVKGKAAHSSKDFLFVNEVNNAAMIETLRKVEGEFKQSSCLELLMDVRITKGSLETQFFFKPISFLSIVKAWLIGFVLLPRFIVFCFQQRQFLKELKLSPFLLWLSFCDSIFLIECVVQTNKRIQPKSVIFNSDVHKTSRIFSLLQSKTKKQSFVLQHGATTLEYGYLPITSDYLLAWGELSKKWFTDRGEDANKIIPLGSPRMDSIKFSTQKNWKITPFQQLLIVMNPIGRSNTRAFLNSVFEAVHKSKNKVKRVTIKLHPGSDDYKELPAAIFKDSKIPYRVLKNSNIHKLIEESDLVISTTSSVGYEAIFKNTPLCQIKLSNYDIPMAYEEFDCCFQTASSDDLVRLLDNPEIIVPHLENYAGFVSQYAYQLDGKSSERCAKFIMDKSN